MLNRNLLAALVLAAASSAVFAAPMNTDTRVVEGKAACTAQVEGTARQTTELKACERFNYPSGAY